MKAKANYQLLFLFCWLIVSHHTMSGTTFYIKASGNDALAGTSPASAWQTINKVNASAINPGDSILFEGGQTFNGTLFFQPPRCGTKANPVYIGSYGTGNATLNAGTSGPGIYIYDCAGFEIANLNVTGAGIASNNFQGVFFYTDVPGSGMYPYIYLHDLNVSGFNKGGINIVGEENFTDRGYRDITILRCNAFQNGDLGIQVLAKFFHLTTEHAIHNVYIAHCQAYDNPGQIGKTNGHTGNGIVVGTADTVVIEHCIAHHNGVGNLSTAGGPIGIWAWECNNATIQFCESYANSTNSGLDGGGFDLDGGCTHSVMQYNYSHDNMGAGYLVAQFTSARAMHHITVRYNISERDAQLPNWGALMIYQGGINPVDSIFFYNNTVFLGNNRGTNTAMVLITRTSLNIGPVLFANNIFMTEDNAPMLRMSHASTVHKFINNLYFSLSGNYSFIQPGYTPGTTTSLANWRTVTGQEKLGATNTGFQTNPLLTDAGNGGTIGNTLLLNTLDAYLPTALSPVIDQALDVQTLVSSLEMRSRDFYGTTIPENLLYDLGAGEWSSVVLPVSSVQLALVEQQPEKLVFEALLGEYAQTGKLSLEYASDGVNFSQTGVELQPDPQMKAYPFSWNRSFNTRTFFRLQWTDDDGSNRYSNLVELSIISISAESLHLAPNPSGNTVQLTLDRPIPVGSLPEVFDMKGQLIRGLNWEKIPTGDGWEAKTTQLPAGIYMIRIFTGTEILSVSWIKN